MTRIENIESVVFKPKPKIWNFNDIEGKRIGRLYVVGYLGRSLSGRTMWLTHCDCGAFIKVSAENLRSGGPVSCGCLK